MREMTRKIIRGTHSTGRDVMRHAGTIAIALLALCLLSAGAQAYTYAGWRFGDELAPIVGDPLAAIDGRGLAMGGAGMASADGARGIALNPALLAMTKGVEVVATGHVVLAEEARDVPLHDSFDGVIADNTYAYNTGMYEHYAATIAWQPSGEFAWAPAVAIGYRPRLDMNYTYHVQYRNPDTQVQPMDKILYDYYADGDGQIGAYTVALGQEMVEGVYAGLAVDFLRGDYTARERTVYPASSDNEDLDSRWEFNDASGTQLTLGLLVTRSHRVDVAVVYRTPFDLDVDDYSVRVVGSEDVTQGSFKNHYPGVFAVGFEYRPRNLIMTTVNADIEYTRWSDFKDGLTGADPQLDDTVVYRIGVEHGFYDQTQARFGFVYEPSYIDNRYARSGFCAGVGMDLLGARLDVGGEIGVREYPMGDGRLRETTTQVMATLVHTF
jgi:hypothetical protein